MGDNRVEELMKKHPPWFMFGFHLIRFAKKLLEEGREDEEETKAESDK